MKILSLILILGCSLVGCKSESTNPPDADTAAATEATHVREVAAGVVTGVHHAMCGCSIEGIGACGNYVEVDGNYVKLVYESIGPMQFCEYKKDGVDIVVVGELKEGELVAQSWELAK